MGDTRESVFETLGEPSGFAVTNGVEAYTFDRGRVLFRGGRVISHTVLSEEEAGEQRETAARQQEERAQEGAQWRDRLLEDENFRALPARERLAYWEALRQRYPQVDLGFDHAVAAQQVQMDQEQELRELELRMMEAERTAELAQKHAPPVYPHHYGSGWPLIFTDQFDPGLVGVRDRFAADAQRVSFPVRQAAPLPPTGRERAMPLQEFGQAPALRPAPIVHDRRPHRRK